MTAGTVVLVIDCQVNQFDPPWAVHDAEALMARVAGLVARTRAAGLPLLFVRHDGGPGEPDEAGTRGWQLLETFTPLPGEVVLDKTTIDTFESTDLEARLRELGAGRLVVAGVQSQHCVRAAALGAITRGIPVTLARDGHSTQDERERPAATIIDAVNAELAGRVELVEIAALP
jgi:nicotinamidase-related amidase